MAQRRVLIPWLLKLSGKLKDNLLFFKSRQWWWHLALWCQIELILLWMFIVQPWLCTNIQTKVRCWYWGPMWADKAVSGARSFCKRLPSHTGQEQACTRITWLFVRSFVCLSPCQKWHNTKENGYWLPPSDHIQSETLFHTRQDKEKEMNGSASLLHSWRWGLLDKFSIIDDRK